MTTLIPKVDFKNGGTTPTGAVNRTINEKLQDFVSVKDFGAIGDNSTDNSTAFQNALNSGVTTVFIPNGEYKLNTTVNIPEGVSIIGEGAKTIIRPIAVNAFLFLASNYIGNVKIANFTVLGDTATQFAFKYESLAAGNRVTGVLFENLTIGNLLPGYFNGLWYSTFRSCTFYNCYIGLQFVGQNIKCLVDDCRIIKGSTGTGDSVGVNIDGAINPIVTGTYVRGEDIQIRNTLIYGFDIAVNIINVMYSAINNCDLDYVQKIGVNATQIDGGFTLRDTWIAIDSASTILDSAIKLNNLGTERTSNAAISNNKLTGINVNSSNGIYLGSNQSNVFVENNNLTGFYSGIYVSGASKLKINGNIVNSINNGLFLFSTTDNSIENNYFTPDIYVRPKGTGGDVLRTYFGQNTGSKTTYASGLIVMPSGATTATVTLASLGFQLLPLNVEPILNFNSTYAATKGAIWGSSDGTNITVYVTTSVGANTNIQFQLRIATL